MAMMNLVALLSALFFSVTPSVVAFAPLRATTSTRPLAISYALKKAPTTTTTTTTALSMQEMDDVLDNLNKKLSDVFSNVNLDSFPDSLDGLVSNAMEGDLGTRGEVYVAAQFALALFILVGGIPIVGDLLTILCGPVLSLAGIAAIFLAINDLGGENFSPWPKPPSGATLKTEGIYGQLRHPMYAGLLGLMAGISVLTGSSSRIVLTFLLFYVLSEKAKFEEKELAQKFPEYTDYMQAVPGRFFPVGLLEQLPWSA